MLSGAELKLFTILSPAPLSAQEVASRIGADLRAFNYPSGCPFGVWAFLSREGGPIMYKLCLPISF